MGMQSDVEVESRIFFIHYRYAPAMSHKWFYKEAIHLQSFTSTLYPENGEYPARIRIRTRARNDLYPICSKQQHACIVWVYHASSYTEKAMSLAPLLEDINRKKYLTMMFGPFGYCTSGHNFYIGTQNESKLGV